MRLIFNAPKKLDQHFSIPQDTTEWVNQPYSKVAGNGGMTPNRSRATFNTLTKAMTATTPYCNPLGKTFGVYILAFNDPHPAFYVGVAGGGGKVPEGVTSRILKHRIKVTGSHVGTGKYKTGGVNHTKHWRDYAVLRAQFYLNKQVPDQCSDARLIIGKLVSPEPHLTKKLEYFEHLIFKNVDGIRDDIYKLLWPGNEPSLVTLLTYKSSERDCPADTEIELWDNKVHRFLAVSLAV